MTELEKDGKYSWGVRMNLDLDPEPFTCGIVEDYINLPIFVNCYCNSYIKRKGRSKERELIRPMVKEILIDLYDLLGGYGNHIVAHILEGLPLKYELLGLELERCQYIFRQCELTHMDKEIIHCDYALFGAMLKEFYLSVNKNFLPNDFRDACKYLGRNKVETDYYSLGEMITTLWENVPRKSPSKVFIGLDSMCHNPQVRGSFVISGS